MTSEAEKPEIPAQSEPELAGLTLGDYRVLRRLGVGAMAVVYLAEQITLQRHVAFKVMKSGLAEDSQYVRRFQHEARAAASLVHANIAQIFEVGCIDGFQFISQEYIRGFNLNQLLQRDGPMDGRQGVTILRQAAAALHKAHREGIVHRDIKPENIMLSDADEIKVADFGLARSVDDGAVNLTQVGVTLGTPLYMSPEQVEGGQLDCRSDIYSLGVTMYHILSGQPPFEGDTPLNVAVQHVQATPQRLEVLRPDLPGGLCRIIHRTLAKAPEDRYQTPAHLLYDLRTLRIDGLDNDRAQDDIEDWNIPELSALSDARMAATAELSTLMKTSSNKEGRRDFGLWLAVGGLLTAFATGLALALFSASGQ